METKLFPKIEETIRQLAVETISEARKETLQPLLDYLQRKTEGQQEVMLNFICTHNSRRSHLSQVWAQALAYHFGLSSVQCYSGGTEATALFPMAAQTLESQGFAIDKISEGKNPVYSIKFADHAHPIIGFSKVYNHPFNPPGGFAAIMTCSQADAGCPFIDGAEARFPITFEDPKAFDNTPQQAEKYLERSRQIATELFYIFSKIEVK